MYYLYGLARCLLAFVYGLMQIRVTREEVSQVAHAMPGRKCVEVVLYRVQLLSGCTIYSKVVVMGVIVLCCCYSDGVFAYTWFFHLLKASETFEQL